MKPNTWNIAQLEYPDNLDMHNYLSLLANNNIAGIRISNFYQKDELDLITKNVKEHGISWYPNLEYKQGRIGICATEYQSKINGKTAYFSLEQESSKIRDSFFPSDGNYLQKLITLFPENYKVGLATDPDNGQYFSGLIRAMNTESTLHFDYAPYELPGWSIEKFDTQFSLITYLQMPEEGGGLTIYNKTWTKGLPVNEDAKSKGYIDISEDVVCSSEYITVVPKPGDVFIINTKNLHKVEGMDVQKTRLTCNSFFTVEDTDIKFWS